MVGHSRRIRLLFNDNEGILSPSQTSDGLNRCWLLLKPQFHYTIADVSAHILHSFGLQPSCPHGLLLYLDGFLLPPFESTDILTERDIISVRKKGVTLSLEGNNATTALDTQNGTLFLANEEFETESGGYQSDDLEDLSQGDDLEEESNKRVWENHLESLNDGDNATTKDGGNVTSKKRKALDKIQGSQKKKRRSAELGNSNVDISQITKSADQGQKNGDEGLEGSAGKRKVSSRSSRRKQAKRRWIREMKKIQKEAEVSQSKGHEWKRPAKAERKNKKNWKRKPTKLDEKQDDGEPKGLLHWNGWAVKNNWGDKSKDEVANQNCSLYECASQKTCLEDEVVPVVIRPGHIRFEHSDKDHVGEQSQRSGESFRLNGINSKRKGHNWGKERPWFPNRKDDDDVAKARAQMLPVQNELRFNEPIKFDNLPPLCDLPKTGDIIGYRLIELSSSWTPELSPYQVGLVTWCSESGKLLLTRFTECPSTPKKSTEKESDPQPDYALYKADGPLEIDFKTLIDVRIVKYDNGGVAAAAAANGDSGGPMEKAALSVLPATDDKQSEVSSPQNGRDLWEQFSEALSDKKTQLAQENSWGKATSSNRISLSYRALQGGALGPTMALLRSKNYLN